jgi:hypothetical protein
LGAGEELAHDSAEIQGSHDLSDFSMTTKVNNAHANDQFE